MPKNQEAPVQAPSVSTRTCVSPIEHNCRRIEIGEIVEVPTEMTEDIAAVLVECGALQA